MAQFGRKMDSLKTLKNSLAKGGSSDQWIKFVPKNGSMNVRFIEEPENWVSYIEHWDTTLRKSFPCSGESTCPGCQADERKSNRYLANAVDVDSDRVIPLQLPKDLANRLVVRYERNGTLTDRDFELSRSGEGLDTVYDYDAGAQDRKKIDKYTPLDLMKTLEDAFNDVFGSGQGSDDDEDDTPPAPKPRARAKSKATAAIARDTSDPDVDTDDDPSVPPRKPEKAARKAAGSKVVGKVPDPKFAPAKAQDADDDDDEGSYDEETLLNLPLGALRAVAREFGFDPRGMDQDTIVNAIMDAGEPVDGEDVPPF